MSPDNLEDREGDGPGEVEEPDELTGKLDANPNQEDKLARTLIEDDQGAMEQGNMLSEAFSNNLSSFIPDMMMANMVNNYKNAKRMYGQRMIRQITGYDADYVERNIKIPEFAREIQGNVNKKVEEMKDKGLLDQQGAISREGRRFASLFLFMQELDHLVAKGAQGEFEHKEISHHGISDEARAYKKGDRYKNLAIRKTIKSAIRRGHKKIQQEDLRIFDQESKGEISIIYAVDTSGSMRGEKLTMAKKAGIALGYKATQDKNKVGMIAFSKDVEEKIEPSLDFYPLLEALTVLNASSETNVSQSIEHATEMFAQGKQTKHLIFLTDAAPTVGDDPEEQTLAQAAEAVAKGITISVIGIQVDEEGQEFAKKMAEVGQGNLYLINDLENLDGAVLQDYAALKAHG